MKSHKRTVRISAIILVCLGCIGAGAWLVLERPLTSQPLSTTLSSALVSAGPSVTASALLRHDSAPSLAEPQHIQESYARIPLSFEANQGQTDSRVKFLARGQGYTLFLAGNDAVLSLKGPSSAARGGKHDVSPRTRNSGPGASDALVRMRLLGANAKAAAAGEGELPGKANYFIGNNPEQWRTNVPTYSQVRYRDVYPGIDLVYYGNQGGQLQYDFVVAPGAEPQAIALDVGAGLVPAQGRPQGSPLRIAADGDLVIAAKGGELRLRKPVAYQVQESTTKNEIRDAKIEDRRLVEARFTLDAQNRVHFALGHYDRTQPLVIDPSLLWSTFLGGSKGDAAYGIAVDSLMNVYVTGYTASSNFPTSNPLSDQSVSEDQFATTYSGSGLTGTKQNAFVAKLSWNGSSLSLVYSTYLGGSGSDSGNGIAVDSAGNAYVVGTTSSVDFPITNPLLGQTVSIAGSPTCPPPSETTCLYSGTALAGSQNAFVAELSWDPTLNLVFSTYLGGGDESSQGIALLPVAATKSTPASENIYVTGYTSSPDFPISNPLTGQSVLEFGSPAVYSGSTLFGSQNAFVAELNWVPSTTTLDLVYSTYLGGGSSDAAYGIAVDSSGTAYVAGTTTSVEFPTVNPIHQSVLENGAAETYSGSSMLGSFANAFVAALSWASATSTLSLPYSTYISGGQDTAYGIAVDSSKNAYITGTTASSTFPTLNALQTQLKGTANAFVAKLNPWAATAGQSLVYSTYLGGSGYDVAYAIALDSNANAYVGGYTSSANFPTENPIQKTLTGGSNAFVSELNWDPTLTLVYSTYLGTGGDYGYGIAVDNKGNTYVAGETHSSTFTSSANHSLQSYGGGITDAFAAEISATSAVSATAKVTLSANSISFGNQKENTTSSAKSVKLTSSGTGSLTLDSITLTGSDPGDFALVGGTKSCPYTTTDVLAVNAFCYIYVTFKPTTTGGRSASVTITDNASGSPQSIGVSGNGTTTGPGKTTTTITSASPNPVIVGGGTKVTMTLTATGSPTGTITVSDGTGDQCIATLPTTYCTLTPTTPGKKTLVASYSGDLNFSSSVSSGYTLTVEAFTISYSPSSQTVSAGRNTGFQLTIASAGGFSGQVTLSCSVSPSGPSCGVAPSPMIVSPGSGSVTSVVTITTSSGTTKTGYTVYITGVSGTGVPATGGETLTLNAPLTVD
jgi:hypothetical protein